MPMGGAGLIRFAQEQSMGLKIGPIATIVASVVLIVVVIFAHKGYLDILF
jgi:preprotein translocase subunit Sec61beta